MFLVGNQVTGPHGFADDGAASAASTRDVRLDASFQRHANQASHSLGPEGKRQADTTADLALGLTALGWMIDDLGTATSSASA